MGLSDGVKVILENARSISVVAIVLVVCFAFIFALVTSRLYLGPDVKRILKRQDTLEETVAKQTLESTEWRVLAAESRVRLEMLEEQSKIKEEECEKMERRLTSVEAELERIRQTWTPPAHRQERDV